MQIGDTKTFKRALTVFVIVAAVLQVVDFGSFYLGRYGFSVAPFAHGQDGLWWLFYGDAETSTGAGMAAALPLYLETVRKRNESKSKVAA